MDQSLSGLSPDAPRGSRNGSYTKNGLGRRFAKAETGR